MADPQGWNPKSQGSDLYDTDKPGLKIGSSGRTGGTILVTTNKSNGNYDVYEKTLFGNKLLYQYNASNNKIVPSEQYRTQYDLYFTGPQASQLTDLNVSVREDTFKIAKNNVVAGQNSLTAQQFASLQQKPGYKTFATNTAQVEPAADPQGGRIETPEQRALGPLAFEEGLDLQGATVTPIEEPAGEIPPADPTPTGPPPVLRYPLANLDAVKEEFGIGYDYIKIKVVDYVPSLSQEALGKGNDPLSFSKNTDTATRIEKLLTFSNSSTDRYNQNSKALAYVVLPMQPTGSGLGESNSVSWGQDSFNILQLVAASFVNSYFNDTAEKGFISAGKDAFMDIINSFGSVKNATLASTQEIAALLAGFATNTQVLQRTTGSVINPNLELLFTGPKMRQFNFNFEMTPRFEEEAEVIRKIIKTFKKYMAPEVKTGNAFLKTPKIFQLEYIYNGDGSPEGQGTQHPYLNKIKPCALMDFQVNYTPDGTYMTYRGGGSMTRYTLQMTFAEVEPIYQGDQDLSSNDMGY